MSKPSVFVGSSSEGLGVARAIELQFQHDAEVTLWTEGIFGLGEPTIESLLNALDRFDFAILVLSPDDLKVSRNQEHMGPRDNVLFELGLFMGRLGKKRTFVVCSGNPQVRLPSDLAGVTVATYDGQRTDRNIVAAVGPACTPIRNTVRDLGPYEGKALGRLQEVTTEMEGASDTVGRIVHLLARSRAVELDLIAEQFGSQILPDHLAKMRGDLKDLEKATTTRVEFSLCFKSAGEGGVQQHGPYEADSDEWERLKADYGAFINQGKPKSGTYRIWFSNRLREKVLDFGELSSLG